MKSYKAILFDFDGVLGKTMEDNFRAWENTFNNHGISISKREYFKSEGLPTKDLAIKYLKLNDMDSDLFSLLVKEKEEHYLRNHSFKLYPGAEPLVKNLKVNGYSLGLVTGGSGERLLNIGIESFLELFDVIITGDLENKGKPYPDPYLRAAKILKVANESCLVIENAPLGIESAKKAGMTCIAVSSTLEKKYLLEADRVVANIIEIQEIIEKGRLK